MGNPDGLTLRLYLAAMAMQGMLASDDARGQATICRHSLDYADQLMEMAGVTTQPISDVRCGWTVPMGVRSYGGSASTT